jgi:antitoxin CcdA
MQGWDRDAPKKSANLSINADLLRKAKELDINISAVAEQRLGELVEDRLREQWLRENAAAFESYNEFVETHGIFGEEWRAF